MNLKITSLVNVKVTIAGGFRRDADTDNLDGLIPIYFVEKCRIEIYTVPFRMNMPNAIEVNFVEFGHGYVEKKTHRSLIEN